MRELGTRRLEQVLALTVVVVALCPPGCSDESGSAYTTAPSGAAPTAPSSAPPPTAQQDPQSHDQLVQHGRAIYMSNCIACHNPNPAQDGALGPPVAGASHTLLEARLIRGEYPPGYTPKSDTRVMIPLPHLENEIDALTAYLAQ